MVGAGIDMCRMATMRVLTVVVLTCALPFEQRAVAQLSPAEKVPVAPSLVRFVEVEPAHCGKVAAGTMAARRVRLENISGVTVQITVRRVSCPCLEVKVVPNELAVGGSAELLLATRAADVAGTQWYTAEVEVATVEGSIQALSIPIGYDPDALVAVRPRVLQLTSMAWESAEATIVVRRMDSRPVGSNVCTPSEEWLEARPGLPSLVRPFEGTLVVASRPRPPGIYFARLAVENLETKGKDEVVVSLRVLPKVTGSPRAIVISGVPKTGTKAAHEIILKQAADVNGPLVLRGVGGPAGAIDAHLVQAGIGKPAVLNVEVDVSKLHSIGSVDLEIEDSDGHLIGVVPVIWLSTDNLGPAGAAARSRSD